MQKFRKQESGFTLVELLIVVAIIGILAAIAIPQFTKYKRNAVEAKAEANLATCVTQLSAEFADIGTDTWNCTIGEDSGTTVNCGLTLDSNGTVTLGTCNGTVDGYTVGCSLNATSGDTTEVDCTAS